MALYLNFHFWKENLSVCILILSKPRNGTIARIAWEILNGVPRFIVNAVRRSVTTLSRKMCIFCNEIWIKIMFCLQVESNELCKVWNILVLERASSRFPLCTFQDVNCLINCTLSRKVQSSYTLQSLNEIWNLETTIYQIWKNRICLSYKLNCLNIIFCSTTGCQQPHRKLMPLNSFGFFVLTRILSDLAICIFWQDWYLRILI